MNTLSTHPNTPVPSAPLHEATKNAIFSLVQGNTRDDAFTIASILVNIPAHLLELAAAYQTRIVVLQGNATFANTSNAVRALVTENPNMDSWFNFIVGIYVVAERTVYLRSVTPETVGHEMMHAIDVALGRGTYLSTSDPCITAAYQSATRFVTPYAASTISEYFAEAGRAMCSLNDTTATSIAGDVSPELLEQLDPRMFARMTQLFAPPQN